MWPVAPTSNPGALVRLAPGPNPPETTLAEIYRFPSVTLSAIPVGSLETTCPGVFAAGDARGGNVKR